MSPADLQAMGHLLRQSREYKGETQAETVAALTLQSRSDDGPIHLRTYQDWEEGKAQPLPKNMRLLADYFGLAIVELIGK